MRSLRIELMIINFELGFVNDLNLTFAGVRIVATQDLPLVLTEKEIDRGGTDFMLPPAYDFPTSVGPFAD